MRLFHASPLAALICSTLATPAMAGSLQPTTSWAVDYGETHCTAVRSFGNEAAPLTLGIVPSLDGENYRLIISQPRTGPTYALQMQGTVDFGRGKLKTGVLHYGKKGVKLSLYDFRISAAQIEQARTSNEVGFTVSNGSGFDFALAEMPSLLDALHKCTADLQQYWNYGKKMTFTPAKASPTSNGKADLRSVFSSEDYPTEALMRMQGGQTQYQLMINEKGEVAGCDLLRQSGIPVLDVMGCQVMMERAKFTPPLDPNGKPARAVLVTPPIVWRVEGGGGGPTLAPTLTGH